MDRIEPNIAKLLLCEQYATTALLYSWSFISHNVVQQCRTKTNGSSRISETSHRLQPRGTNSRKDRPDGLDFVLKEALDKLQDFGHIDPLGVSDARTVAVGYKGIDSQNDIRPAQQIWTA